MVKNKIAWFIPMPIEVSGGHRTILQHAQYLVDNGYECHMYFEDTGEGFTARRLVKIIEKYFGKYDFKYFLGYELKENYDLIFATVWFTAKPVREQNPDILKAYFIQDYEALFNPMGDSYLLAENSYKYGLHPITIGKWLTSKMINDYKTPSNYFDFCADLNIYHKTPSIKREKAICFIYQPEKPRRCSILGVEALGIVKHHIPDIKIYLYGSKKNINCGFDHENLHLLDINECNDLYNKCMAGLCISASNPSRIPFEMMASGLPVVDIFMENNLYDMPEEGVLLAEHTPESIAQAIITLINDEELRNNMSDFSTAYMKKRDLDTGHKQFLHGVNKILANEEKTQIEKVAKIYKKAPIKYDKSLFKYKFSNYNYLKSPDRVIHGGPLFKFLTRMFHKPTKDD